MAANYPAVSDRAANPELTASCLNCPVRSHTVCAAIDDRVLARREMAGTSTRYSPGEVVCAEGDPASSVYIVTAGVLRAFRFFGDGRCQVLGFVLPGDFIGSSVDGRHSYSVDAAGAAIVCRFPRVSFWHRMPLRPRSLTTITDAFARCLGQAHQQIMLLGGRSARGKVAGFLTDMATRAGRVRETEAFLALPMTRRDIGDYLGLNISTVSRTLHRLAKSGRIAVVRGGVRILDLQALARDRD